MPAFLLEAALALTVPASPITPLLVWNIMDNVLCEIHAGGKDQQEVDERDLDRGMGKDKIQRHVCVGVMKESHHHFVH